jgi:hypothetical protein
MTMQCQRKPNDLLKRLGDRAFWKYDGEQDDGSD